MSPDVPTSSDPAAPSEGSASAGVELADGRSAAEHLHRIVTSMVSSRPDVFAGVEVPDDVAAFKRSYARVLPEVEAARSRSPHRAELASTAVEAARSAFDVHPSATPLAEAVAGDAQPFDVETVELPGSAGLVPRVPFGDRSLEGEELASEVRALVERGSASPAVADAIESILASGEPIDLTGRRIVMFGAGAELAPTRLWLEAGADVLWLDLTDPPVDLLGDESLAGTVTWVPGGVDLLADPARVRATIAHVVGGDAVDLGLYAYAPGRAREWRLTAAMNAIVEALDRSTVRGVAMLVSPTTCAALDAETLDAERARRRNRPRWQAVMEALHLLGRGGGHATAGGGAANRAIVPIQGTSYQAAQYVGKLLTAEAWAAADDPFGVSANTAGISLTSSLQHPVFDLAFAGAEAFGVETFDPSTTTALNGLLTLHDRLGAAGDARDRDDPATLFATRVHGGVDVLPYPIEPALRVAAAIGVLRDPRRLKPLLRR